MIPRTLVPTDVRPFTDNGDKKPPRRLTTYMDDRTVVPSDLSDAPPLTGKTSIPAHLPLDVLVERSLVPRGLGVKPFQQFLPPIGIRAAGDFGFSAWWSPHTSSLPSSAKSTNSTSLHR